VPRKSGHMCNAYLTIIQHGGRCPDLSGPGTALLIGHEIKRHLHTPMKVSFMYNPEAKRQGQLLK
jgi:hypothetical protein